MASGHEKSRSNRPNTWQLRPAVQYPEKPLPTRSRSLIASPMSSRFLCFLPGVTVLSAVGKAAATSGPKPRRYKVHNGLW